MEKKLALALNLITIQIAAMEQAELSLDKPIEIKDHVVCNGHKSFVHSVCVTPDNRIVSASYDGTTRIWDIQGNELFANKIHGSRLLCMSPDNKIILITCYVGTKSTYPVVKQYEIPPFIHILDTTGIELTSWKAHNKYAFCLCTTPDAKIVSGFRDKRICFWDMNGKKVATLKGHKGPVKSVCMADDNKLISGSDDNTVRIWDLKSKKAKPVVCKGHEGFVNSVCVTFDTNIIVSGSDDKTIRLWDMQGMQLLVYKGHGDGVNAVCVTHANKIVSGSKDKTLRVWDMRGNQLAVCKGHEDNINSVYVAPNGKIVSGSRDFTVRIWDISVLGLPQGVKQPALMGNGKPSEGKIVETTYSNAFAPRSEGFSEHPTFVGALLGQTYEIWKNLSQNEAEVLRPLTSMPIPPFVNKLEFILGRGRFGVTYVGSNFQTKALYAIKEVRGREVVDQSLREGKIVHYLGDYPHIMPLVDYMYLEPSQSGEEPRLLQVMPLAYKNGIEVKRMLSILPNDKRELLVADSFKQLMLGLEYLHKKGVVHLDIKADNILYMKEGTLRIADFGRAQQVSEHEQIADMYSLGDIRKFSPEIVAFLRKCFGSTFEIVESFSGKEADVWAAGLFIWELLEEDNSETLFSTKKVPVEDIVTNYTYENFEQLVENVNALKGRYSLATINLLRQALAVDPALRIKTSQVIAKLIGLSEEARKVAFEEALRKIASSTTAAISAYSAPDSTFYLNKESAQTQPAAYLPADFYARLNNTATVVTNQISTEQPTPYLPSNFYALKK